MQIAGADAFGTEELDGGIDVLHPDRVEMGVEGVEVERFDSRREVIHVPGLGSGCGPTHLAEEAGDVDEVDDRRSGSQLAKPEVVHLAGGRATEVKAMVRQDDVDHHWSATLDPCSIESEELEFDAYRRGLRDDQPEQYGTSDRSTSRRDPSDNPGQERAVSHSASGVLLEGKQASD